MSEISNKIISEWENLDRNQTQKGKMQREVLPDGRVIIWLSTEVETKGKEILNVQDCMELLGRAEKWVRDNVPFPRKNKLISMNNLMKWLETTEIRPATQTELKERVKQWKRNGKI